MHAVYMRIAAVGAGGSPVLELTSLRIGTGGTCSCSAILQPSPRDLVGSGHRPLLRQFTMDSANLRYVDPLPYLE